MIEFVANFGVSNAENDPHQNSPRNKQIVINDISKKIILTETLLTASCEFYAIFDNVFKHLN